MPSVYGTFILTVLEIMAGFPKVDVAVSMRLSTFESVWTLDQQHIILSYGTLDLFILASIPWRAMGVCPVHICLVYLEKTFDHGHHSTWWCSESIKYWVHSYGTWYTQICPRLGLHSQGCCLSYVMVTTLTDRIKYSRYSSSCRRSSWNWLGIWWGMVELGKATRGSSQVF